MKVSLRVSLKVHLGRASVFLSMFEKFRNVFLAFIDFLYKHRIISLQRNRHL